MEVISLIGSIFRIRYRRVTGSYYSFEGKELLRKF